MGHSTDNGFIRKSKIDKGLVLVSADKWQILNCIRIKTTAYNTTQTTINQCFAIGLPRSGYPLAARVKAAGLLCAGSHGISALRVGNLQMVRFLNVLAAFGYRHGPCDSARRRRLHIFLFICVLCPAITRAWGNASGDNYSVGFCVRLRI